MKKLLTILLFLPTAAMAFVSGPSSVGAGENYIGIGTQSERGKVEPNENRSSFQGAQIDIYKLKYVRGFEGLLGLGSSNVYFESGSFSSSKEQVGSTLFYERDQGSYLTLGLSGDFVHELEKQFGFYVQASPLRSYNKDKFSNPRLDMFAVGLTSAFNITDDFFQRNLIHYGSGEGSHQNSYLAIDTGFGYRLNRLGGRPLTVSGSLFLEADMSERNDPAYDAAFSPSGTRDRVRAFKYGTLLGADMGITNRINLSVNYLQKLGGYDARSTKIYTANIGFKF
ncbi:MAG: hypothetical protein IPJ71_10835 [Bdellovibrionales bacterium]|nr:hypothetical protein [Bdellovibrionales bacterium]